MIHIEFNETKSLNVILYILEMSELRNAKQIYEMLYLADCRMVAEWLRPITGDSYRFVDSMPVPIYLSYLISNIGASEVEGHSKPFRFGLGWFLDPIAKTDLDEIAEAEKKILDEVIADYIDAEN